MSFSMFLSNPEQFAEDISPLVTQYCSLTETAVLDLWLSIVQSIEEILQQDTPIIVWHLEQDYLTIFTTGLKQIHADSSINCPNC